jgi:hypothetical protein
MTQPEKPKRKKLKPLKDDIFNHLDVMYRLAKKTKNIALALKAVEVCIKAKQALGKQSTPLMNIQEASDDELEKMVQMLKQEE